MNNKPTPATKSNNSGCTSCFVLSIALIAMAVVIVSIVGPMLFEGWEFPGSAGQSSPAVGKTLTDLDLVPITLNEQPVSRADLSGKVALVNLWATWCGPCRKELPDIAEIGEEFVNHPDFMLLPVSCGNDDLVQLSTDSILLLQEMGLQMPCYSDPSSATRRAFARAAETNQLVLPTTMILDRQGVIRGVWVGYTTSQDKKKIRELITKLLGEGSNGEGTSPVKNNNPDGSDAAKESP